MKYLTYDGLRTLTNLIKGDINGISGNVIPTFEEVYDNLINLDEDTSGHTEGSFQSAEGLHGLRYINGAFEVAVPTYTPVTPSSGDNPSEEGWYEETSGTYSPTDDTTPTQGKTYYEKTVSWTEVQEKAVGEIEVIPAFSQKTYTGSAQTVITAGEGTGDMYYYLSDSSTAPASNAYSTSLPTLTNATAGTYYLWYYSAETSQYKATTPTYVVWPGTADHMLMQKATPTITKSETSVSLGSGQMTYDVTISAVTDGIVTVSSSDTAVATIANPSGNTYRISAVATGSCTINISVAAGDNYVAASDSISVSVTIASNTLNDNSWATISAISAAGTASSYWSVGDCKEITLNGTVGTLALSNQKLCVYILGFDHNSAIEGSGITFGGFKTAVTGGTDVCLIDGHYNSYTTNGSKWFNMNHWGNYNYGGWAASDVRYDVLGSTNSAPSSYGSARTTSSTGNNPTNTCATSPVSNTLMAALPSDLRAVMKPITKYTDNKGNSSTAAANVTTTIDYLPLMSEYEVFGSTTYANTNEATNQARYAYYANNNSRVKYRHSSTGSTAYWWLRSPNRSSASFFVFVSTDGSVSIYYSRISTGLAPLILI